MTAIIIIGIAAVLVLAAGAYLRWGIIPVRGAYELGRQAERITTARRARHAGAA